MVKVKAVPRGFRVESDKLQIAQGVEAVTLLVGLAFLDRHIAEIRSRFDIEEEEQTVDHAEAFDTQLACVNGILA
jgi:hypothetical protein